jgi:hypothetical protein
MLAFDSPDALSGGYEAAVKSLTEHLRPLLEKVPDVGRPTVAHHDRVRELRITQGHQPGGEGVVVTVWPLGHAFHNWRPHLFPPWRAWSSDRPRRGEFHCSVCGVRALCPNGCGALRAQWHDDEQGQSEMTWYCWRCESEWLDEETFGECRRP